MKDETIKELNSLIDGINEEYFDILEIFKDKDPNTLQDIINYYLLNIKNIKNKSINVNICNNLLKYFDYNYGINDGNIRKTNYAIMEEANIIADDLIEKIKNVNNRSITYPIDLNTLTEYSISCYINSDSINKCICYIIVKLAVVYSFYK